LAKAWCSLVTSTQDGGFEHWAAMRAEFYEHSMFLLLRCPLLEQKRNDLISSIEVMGRNLLSSLNIDHSDLRISDMGVLRTRQYTGFQEIHADIQTFETSSLCYSVIMYLVDTDSTALADIPCDALDPVWKMNLSAAKEVFSRVHFVSERVACGDTAVFSGKTFHYGVENPDAYQRYIGFTTFTPKRLPKVDSQYQFYPTGTGSIHSNPVSSSLMSSSASDSHR